MRTIGLDLVFIRPGRTGGMETYARRLVPLISERLRDNRFIAFVGRDLAREMAQDPWGEGIEVVSVPIASSSPIMRSFAEWTLLEVAMQRHQVDLIHGLGNVVPLGIGSKRVVTIHDCIPITHPESSSQVRSRGAGFLMRTSARLADRIITVSQATRSDVVEKLGVNPSKIDVVPSGGGATRIKPSGEEVARRRLGLGERPIVLAIASSGWHKNIRNLGMASTELRGTTLVIVGRAGLDVFGPHGNEVHSKGVVLPGWVSQEDLEALYSIAECVVVPSLAEGFGLPILEAMERDVPVIASDIPIFREIAGDAVEYFDPRSPQAIAAAINRVLHDPNRRQELIRAGQKVRSRFSWDRAADKTVDSYERAWGSC